jgi:glycosyltransferase involved in cell wall biosynthesis
VCFAGHVEGGVLAALYAEAQLLVYVPLLEGFGLPPVEAMAAGTPVVSSPLPSIGSAALVVDPLRVESIAEGLLAVVSDNRLREDRIAAGLSRASQLTWAAAAAGHIAFWEQAS